MQDEGVGCEFGIFRSGLEDKSVREGYMGSGLEYYVMGSQLCLPSVCKYFQFQGFREVTVGLESLFLPHPAVS